MERLSDLNGSVVGKILRKEEETDKGIGGLTGALGAELERSSMLSGSASTVEPWSLPELQPQKSRLPASPAGPPELGSIFLPSSDRPSADLLPPPPNWGWRVNPKLRYTCLMENRTHDPSGCGETLQPLSNTSHAEQIRARSRLSQTHRKALRRAFYCKIGTSAWGESLSLSEFRRRGWRAEHAVLLWA